MHTLDGETTPKQFVEFLKDNLPNFYEYSLNEELPLFKVTNQLHEVSYCNERNVVGDNVDLDLDSHMLHEYLHSLTLSCKLYRERIEIIYSYII